MNEITTTKSFQEKMFDRIRDQMGDLMGDQELKALVDAAMNKAFFEPIVTEDSWGRKTNLPPHLITLVRNEMQTQVQKACAAWCQEHPDEMQKALKECLEKGMFEMALSYFHSRTSMPLSNLHGALLQKGVL